MATQFKSLFFYLENFSSNSVEFCEFWREGAATACEGHGKCLVWKQKEKQQNYEQMFPNQMFARSQLAFSAAFVLTQLGQRFYIK